MIDNELVILRRCRLIGRLSGFSSFLPEKYKESISM